MTAAFLTAFTRLIGHEGEFSIDPEDSGNWTGGKKGSGVLNGTKYGVSAKAYPSVNISALTLEGAEAIYLQDYWRKARCHELSEDNGFQVFDAAVNHGVVAAIKMMQRTASVKDDGLFGNGTLLAVRAMSDRDFLLRFLAERLTYMTDAKTWGTHGRGWARRIAGNLKYAVVDLNTPDSE